MKTKVSNIAEEWKGYLQRGGVPEDQMHEIQRVETKKAFYGGFSSALLVMRNEIGAIDDENEAVNALDSLLDQVRVFWESQLKSRS